MKIFQIFKNPNNSTLNIPKAERIKEILNKHVSPMLEELGLNHWNGNYTWFGDINSQGIRPVFQFVQLKGLSGTFTYGNCFSFIPTINSRNKLVNHHTEKSVVLHLFERTEGWRESFNGKELSDTVSYQNEAEFEESLKKLSSKYNPIIKEWFSSNQTLLENIATANRQIERAGAYSTNYPSQAYILGFLYAKAGQKEMSDFALKQFYLEKAAFLPKETIENLIGRIEKIKVGANII